MVLLNIVRVLITLIGMFLLEDGSPRLVARRLRPDRCSVLHPCF